MLFGVRCFVPEAGWMYEPTIPSSGPPPSLSGVTALPPTLLDSLSSLLTGQKGRPWMDVLPPRYLCGHRLGQLARMEGGEALLGLKGERAALCLGQSNWETPKQKHLQRGVLKVRRGPTDPAGVGMPLTQDLLSLAILAFLDECHNHRDLKRCRKLALHAGSISTRV